MPPRIELGIATREHSPGLCRLFRETPMSGGIELAMEREPDYFLGAALHSTKTRVVVACEREQGVVAGASLAERPVYVDGVPRDVGFLSDLRIHPRHRRGTLLGRMTRFAREQDWLKSGFAQSIVVRDNRKALDLMGEARRGAPRFIPAGDYASPAVYLRGRQPSLEGRYRIRPARSADIQAMQAFLDRESPAKQFYPCYRLSELADSPYFRGLGIENYYLAFAGEELVGITGVWDQGSFKQTRIVAYHGSVKFLRPLYNLLAPVTGRPGLPSPGSILPSFSLHTVCVRGNDAEIFSVLVRRINNDHVGLPFIYFLCGFDNRDPLLRVLRAYPHQDFGGKHFLMTLAESDRPAIPKLDPDRLFYLEAARI